VRSLVLLALATALLAAGCSGGSTDVAAPDVQKANARKLEKG